MGVQSVYSAAIDTIYYENTITPLNKYLVLLNKPPPNLLFNSLAFYQDDSNEELDTAPLHKISC